MKRNPVMSTIVILCIFSMLFAVGCTKSAPPSSSVSSTAPASGKPPINMRLGWRGTPAELIPEATEYALSQVKERFNITLEIEYIDKNAFNEKVAAIFASGDFPDMLTVSDYVLRQQAIDHGVLLPVTDYIMNSPEWQNVDPQFLESGKSGDDYYAFADRINLPDTIFLRSDWLENVGKEIPTTPEELYDVVKAFALEDPDKNGADDTFGFSAYPSLGGAGNVTPIWRMFVGEKPDSFYVDPADDTVKTPLYDVEGMTRGLNWFKTAYDEKVLDPEWVLNKQTDVENKFVTGKTGMWVTGANWITPRAAKLAAAFPGSGVATVPAMKTNTGLGTNYFASVDVGDLVFLTKSCEEPERAAEMLGWWFSDEGVLARYAGAPDVTYKVENDKLVWLAPNAEVLYNPGLIVSHPFPDISLPVADPVYEAVEKVIQGFPLSPLKNAVLLQSESYSVNRTSWGKVANEYVSKFIMGEVSIDQYQELIDELKANGMDTALTELNEAYQASK